MVMDKVNTSSKSFYLIYRACIIEVNKLVIDIIFSIIHEYMKFLNIHNPSFVHRICIEKTIEEKQTKR